MLLQYVSLITNQLNNMNCTTLKLHLWSRRVKSKRHFDLCPSMNNPYNKSTSYPWIKIVHLYLKICIPFHFLNPSVLYKKTEIVREKFKDAKGVIRTDNTLVKRTKSKLQNTAQTTKVKQHEPTKIRSCYSCNEGNKCRTVSEDITHGYH